MKLRIQCIHRPPRGWLRVDRLGCRRALPHKACSCVWGLPVGDVCAIPGGADPTRVIPDHMEAPGMRRWPAQLCVEGLSELGCPPPRHAASAEAAMLRPGSETAPGCWRGHKGAQFPVSAPQRPPSCVDSLRGRASRSYGGAWSTTGEGRQDPRAGPPRPWERGVYRLKAERVPAKQVQTTPSVGVLRATQVWGFAGKIQERQSMLVEKDKIIQFH